MKLQLILALLLVALVPQFAQAQGENPDITEARSVILEFCNSFLEGDSEAAIATIDSRAPEYQGYVRMIPIISSQAQAENELFNAVGERFGEATAEPYRSLDTISTLPYLVIHGIEEFDIAIEDEGSVALLQYPIEGEEPMNILLLNRVGESWKIDASESLGMPLPENEQHWAAWSSNAQLFISHMNELREEVPSFETADAFQARFAEHIRAWQEGTVDDGSGQ